MYGIVFNIEVGSKSLYLYEIDIVLRRNVDTQVKVYMKSGSYTSDSDLSNWDQVYTGNVVSTSNGFDKRSLSFNEGERFYAAAGSTVTVYVSFQGNNVFYFGQAGDYSNNDVTVKRGNLLQQQTGNTLPGTHYVGADFVKSIKYDFAPTIQPTEPPSTSPSSFPTPAPTVATDAPTTASPTAGPSSDSMLCNVMDVLGQTIFLSGASACWRVQLASGGTLQGDFSDELCEKDESDWVASGDRVYSTFDSVSASSNIVSFAVGPEGFSGTFQFKEDSSVTKPGLQILNWDSSNLIYTLEVTLPTCSADAICPTMKVNL